MGFLAWLTGAGPIIDKGLEIVDKTVVDKDLRNQLHEQFRALAINHRSIIVTILLAGPKPALMWVAVIGFALHYIANPIFHMFGLPILELQVQDLYALAGLGGFSILGRSWEKVKNATSNH